ncbi:MAG: D-alanyl-D-alanine carboxypeptidase family protein [Clostridia bacterium]|nr:D-alanyl-D-alanine carboxypeptidase family protein [Clostridia bacterium]
MVANRVKRESRIARQRSVIVAICFVVVLLLCLYLFLIISQVASVIHANRGNPQSETQDGGNDTGKLLEDQTLILDSKDYHSGLLIQIGKSSPFDFSANAFLEEQLEAIPSNSPYFELGTYSPIYSPKYLNKTALDALTEMLKTFYEQTGHDDMTIVSAWRSESDQAALNADTSTIKAGESEYHSSYSVGLKILDRSTSASYKMYVDKPEYGEWMDANAYKFGYILSEPDQESKTRYYEQTFRYVGVAASTYMYNNNLSFSEYLKAIRKTSADGDHFSAIIGNMVYESYYVPATGDVTILTIPATYNYTYSGDNLQGFIVTYWYQTA